MINHTPKTPEEANAIVVRQLELVIDKLKKNEYIVDRYESVNAEPIITQSGRVIKVSGPRKKGITMELRINDGQL